MTRNYPAPESVTSAGLEFNYSVWTPGTVIQLCNVPWTSDYRDIVQFDTRDELDNYLVAGSGPIVTFTQMSYAKPNTPINISLPFNAAYKYNYLRVSNPLQPISGDVPKTFYYFITNIRYIAPNTTELMLQLDVWQTFFADVEFGRCYVERGHIGIANENADNLNGREYLTVPEGFDMGNEYTIRKVDAHKFEVTDEVLQTASIIIVSTVDIEQSGGTIEKPELNTASGQISNWVPSGANVYFARGSSLFILMGRLAEKPWISQGIIACYMIPPFMSSEVNALTNDDPIAIDGTPVEGVWRLRTYPREQEVTLLPSWRTIMRDLVPERYRHLTKFLTYPYSFIELTMHNGTPLVMKPECLTTNDLDLAVANMVTPPNPRVMIYPKGYNDYSDASQGIEGEYLDFATGIINMPQIPIVNNAYLNYMASNMNSIAFQHTSADWSQQRALQSNAVGFDQATGAISTNTDLTGLSVNAANQSMMLANQTNTYRAATSIVGSAANGLASPGGAGAVGAMGSIMSTAADALITQNQNTQQTGINNQLATGRTGRSNQQSAFVRDTNKEYADWAARGDYSTAIAGINARVQDAKMIQPTISGQIGGDAFNFSYQRGYVIAAKVKMIDPAAMNSIGEYWLRYGYAINRFSMVNKAKLLCMSNFAYWKMKELYITSSTCPEAFRQTMRGIFEKGVTVWRYPHDIASLDLANNQPLNGITL